MSVDSAIQSGTWSDVLDWIYQTPYARSNPGQSCLKGMKKIRRLTVGSWNHIRTAALVKAGRNNHQVKIDRSFHQKFLEHGEQTLPNTAFVLLHEANHLFRSDLWRVVSGLSMDWNSMANFIQDVFVNASLFQNGFPPVETVTQQLYQVQGLKFFLLPPHWLIKKRVAAAGQSNALTPFIEMPERLWARAEKDVERNHALSSDDPPGEGTLGDLFQCNVKPWLREQVMDDIDWKRPDEKRDGFDRLFTAYLDSWFGGLDTEQLARLFDDLLHKVPHVRAIGASHRRGRKGRGDGETDELTTRRRRPQRISWFANVVERALVQGSRSQRPVRAKITQRGVVPSSGRTGMFLMSQGTWPVFFDQEIEGQTITDRAAHLYVDSSGSMSDKIVDLISELVIGSEGLIAEPIHLFTTEVKDVSLQELKKGKRLDGGTRINVPLAHARENKRERFIVITDGYVEDIDPVNRQFLNQSEMFLIYEQQSNEQLNSHCEKYWEGIGDYL